MALSGNEPISSGNLAAVMGEIGSSIKLLFDGSTKTSITLTERADNFDFLLVSVLGYFSSNAYSETRAVIAAPGETFRVASSGISSIPNISASISGTEITIFGNTDYFEITRVLGIKCAS